MLVKLFRIGTLVALCAALANATVSNRYPRWRSERRDQGRPRSRAASNSIDQQLWCWGDHPQKACAGLRRVPATGDLVSDAPPADSIADSIPALPPILEQRIPKRPRNYCISCERDARGRIKRDRAARRAFVRTHPCPATGAISGACPGWIVDHIVPLYRGGPDTPRNMQWLTREEARAKDRVE